MGDLVRRWRRLQRLVRTRYWTWKATRWIADRGTNVRVNARSSFSPHTHLGDNVHFNGMSVRGSGRVEIGDNFHSGPECIIMSDMHNYEGDALPYDATVVHRPVRIGRNVWFGARVIVLGGVTIGDGAIIQPGSVVVSDIPEMAIAGGHPARVFSHRDAERYRSLDAQRRYS